MQRPQQQTTEASIISRYPSASRVFSSMQCPVCYELLHPPIHLCQKGHPICGECYEKLEITAKSIFPSCPVCSAYFQFMSIAASLVELVYNFMEVNCKYYTYGCKVVLEGEMMRLHMETCIHRPKRCPRRVLDACFWEGHVSLLENHIRRHHWRMRPMID